MNRNTTIDMAKGIAICLMVIGHCYSKDNFILTSIYAFHMPFFFIISGMLYADKWKNGVAVRILPLFRKLLVPYVVFELLFSLFVLILQRSQSAAKDLIEIFLKTILPMIGTTVTWFLPCQLFVVLFAALVLRIARTKRSVFGIASFIVLFALALLVPVPNRYLSVLWRVLIGMGFFAMGYYGKVLINRPAKVWMILFCGGTFVVLATLNGMVSLVGMKLSNPILYTINGFLGTYVMYQICLRWSERNVRFLSSFGRNTAVVLCTHMFAVEIIRLLDYKLFDNILYCFGLLEGLVFGGIVMAIMFVVIQICNRYFWYLFGPIRRA